MPRDSAEVRGSVQDGGARPGDGYDTPGPARRQGEVGCFCDLGANMTQEISRDLSNLLHSDPAYDRIQPPVTSRLQLLPFNALSWENFERLCARLIASESEVVDCHRYGVRGDFQAGIDLLAHRQATEGKLERWCYQCKRWKQMSPADLRGVVGRFQFESDYYVILASFEAQASLRQVLSDLANVDLWDAEDISSRLKDQSALVEDFFGVSWRKAFCGPLTEQESSKVHVDKRQGIFFGEGGEMHKPVFGDIAEIIIKQRDK